MNEDLEDRKLQKRLKNRVYMRGYQRIRRMLDPDRYQDTMDAEASRRGITKVELRHRLLATICNDNLFKAVLDD